MATAAAATLVAPPPQARSEAESAGTNAPCIMSFPAGLPPKDWMRNSSFGGLKIGVSRMEAAQPSVSQLRLRAETDKVAYVGDSIISAGTPAYTGQLLVGVYDKQSGRVQLCHPSRLFVLQPRVKNPVTSLEPGESLARETQRRALTSELGSEKSRKRQKAAAATQVDSERVFNRRELSKDISSALKAAPPAILINDEASARPLLPKYNLEAATTREAYPREGLVPQKVWVTLNPRELLDALSDPAAMKELDERPHLWPPFVLRRLRNALPEPEELKLLHFLALMLRFSAANRTDFAFGGNASTSRALRAASPVGAWSHLVKEFTVTLPATEAKKKRRKMTDEMRHKLALHAHALALHICGGELGTAELATSLALPEDRGTFYLKQLGCGVSKSTLGSVAKLKLPLKLPRLERPNRKGR